MINKSMSWQDKALAATNGSQFGAILRCALDRNEPDDVPCFNGKASVTSDGFVMCNFIDRDGRCHLGAFVGSATDLHRNVAGLANHLKLNVADHNAMRAAIANWIGRDWRS